MLNVILAALVFVLTLVVMLLIFSLVAAHRELRKLHRLHQMQRRSVAHLRKEVFTVMQAMDFEWDDARGWSPPPRYRRHEEIPAFLKRQAD